LKVGESLAAKRHKNNKREKKGLLSEVPKPREGRQKHKEEFLAFLERHEVEYDERFIWE
jgi:hypothetical protein